jgi:hypothetical protein
MHYAYAWDICYPFGLSFYDFGSLYLKVSLFWNWLYVTLWNIFPSDPLIFHRSLRFDNEKSMWPKPNLPSLASILSQAMVVSLAFAEMALAVGTSRRPSARTSSRSRVCGATQSSLHVSTHAQSPCVHVQQNARLDKGACWCARRLGPL